MSKAKDMTGLKFGRLTFVRPTTERSKTNGIIWELKCDCGNTHFCPAIYLTRTKEPTLSCGCLKHERLANTLKDFYAKIAAGKPDECWEWQGTIETGGYGVFSWESKSVKAHRFVWETTNGDIPAGMFICHKCDNRPCCNPDHLFLGTHEDNMADMTRKGREAKGEMNGSAILTEKEVMAIRKEYAHGNVSCQELGDKYGVAGATISHIIRRVIWKHI